MPSVTLVLLANLRHYAGGREQIELPFREGATIADYLQESGVPDHAYYAVVYRDAVTRDLDLVPGCGDVVELLPVMSGG